MTEQHKIILKHALAEFMSYWGKFKRD